MDGAWLATDGGGQAVEHLYLAADNPTPFWPMGAIMLVVITLISGSIGVWRTRRMKKGKRY